MTGVLVQRFYIFFFNDTATTEIYTLSLHDALPISILVAAAPLHFILTNSRCGSAPTFYTANFSLRQRPAFLCPILVAAAPTLDRKSTRLNSSHLVISYAVFCLKKKTQLTSTLHHPLFTFTFSSSQLT